MEKTSQVLLLIPDKLGEELSLMMEILNRSVSEPLITTVVEKIEGKEIEKYLFKNNFKVVKNEGEYYIRIIEKRDGSKSIKDIGPMPKNIIEELVIPLYELHQQERYAIILVKLIKNVLKDPSEKIPTIFARLREIRKRKIAAIHLQDFEKAAELRDQERDLEEKLFLGIKEKISKNKRLKGATDGMIRDILKLID